MRIPDRQPVDDPKPPSRDLSGGSGRALYDRRPASSRTRSERWDAGVSFWALGGQPHHETEQVGRVIAHTSPAPLRGARPPSRADTPAAWSMSTATAGCIFNDCNERRPLAPRTSHRRLHDLVVRHARGDAQPAGGDSLRYGRELVMLHWSVAGSGLAVQRLLDPARITRRSAVASMRSDRLKSPACWVDCRRSDR